MYVTELILLSVLLSAVVTYPLLRPSDVAKRLLSTRMDESRESSDDDYKEKMADIFDISLEDDGPIILENCENVICMPHYLCINDVVVTDGIELFELRISSRGSMDRGDNLVCGHMEMPCCADEALKNMQFNDTQNDRPDESEEYEDENEVNDVNTILPGRKCGYRKRQNTATRIIDSDEAQPNEFPWMVGLFLRLRTGDLRYLGGASLIHESVILTAAHLVQRYTPEQLVVRAGEHDILSTKSDEKRQEQNVTNIIVHEHVYAQALINDIALIVLERGFKLTATVNTICLPPQSIQTDENVMCSTSGWGKNSGDRHGKYQATLKKVELSIVGRGKCEHLLRRTRLGPFYSLNNSLMCAGGGRQDTCKGDGGSPLFCEIPHDENRFYQTGIVAGGIGCGSKIPGLYVNVAHFSNWITHQLEFINMNLEPQNVLQYELFD